MLHIVSSLAFLALLLTAPANGADELNKPTSMNGYSLKDFEGFQNDWHLVTVRFRRDNGEMRFTYANDLAWATISSGKSDYPDGAVFAKTAAITTDDPAFTSSAVPSATRRFQFMVRNRAKHKETNGWGYALFDATGRLYPENPHSQEMACAACHRLVPDRGYVFSQKMILGASKSDQKITSMPSDLLRRAAFQMATSDSQPPTVKNLLADFSNIYLLKGEMQKAIFQGTLDEIKPILSKQAAETGLPSALISDDGKRYSIAVPEKKSVLCTGAKTVALKIITSPIDGLKSPSELSVCYER